MSERPVFLLTTIDNPYNPFTHWSKWFYEDQRLGYDTPGLVARFAASDSEIVSDEANDKAMSDVVKHNFSGKHIKVTKEDWFFKKQSSIPKV
jgi:hypothetical protein